MPLAKVINREYYLSFSSFAIEMPGHSSSGSINIYGLIKIIVNINIQAKLHCNEGLGNGWNILSKIYIRLCV